MSHRALVAERQQNGRFSLYHSRNGAENIQLLEELRDSLNIHGRIDFESLTGQPAPQLVQQLAACSTDADLFNINQTENIVDPNPIATNLPQEAILLTDNILQYEVLYVVDNGEVEGYWLAWLCPDVLQPWRDYIEVEVYKNSPTDITEFTEYLKNNDPELIIDDFEGAWLEDSEKRSIVRDYHRWIYELQACANPSGDSDIVRGALPTPMYDIVFRADSIDPLVPTTYPYFVPIRLDSSRTEPEADIRETANQVRFCLGAELEALGVVSEDKINSAYNEVLQGIVESYTNDIAPQFIPGELGDILSKYQDTREWTTIDWN